MTLRAVVFDAGGTLIHPARPVGETYARFARKHGAIIDAEATTAAFRRAMKNAGPRPPGTVPVDGDDRAWWREIVRRSFAIERFGGEERFGAFFEEVYLYYAEPAAWSLYPEVPEVLRALHEAGLTLAVLSNWDARLHPVLEGHGLGALLDRRFVSAELGREKPDPAVYDHVARALGLEPGSILSVGDDRRNDVEGPERAGWRALEIDRPAGDLRRVLQIAAGMD